jgi:hypothetical protein
VNDELDVALTVARALETVGAPYFLGGSLASSLQGEPRSTNDIDFVADLLPEHVDPLADALGPDFEIDRDALKRAARERSSWNIFHLPLVLKVDLFVAGTGAFDRSELARRRRVAIGEGVTLYVKSPEDSVLRKLLWFRDGGEASDRQWRDILGVLRVSGGELDQAYLDSWAPRLGVAELLQRARGEAGA